MYTLKTTAKFLVAIVATSLLLVGCATTDLATKFKNDEIETLPCIVVLPTKVPFENKDVGTDKEEDLQTGAHFLQRELTKELRMSQVSLVIDPEQLNYKLRDLSGDNYTAIQSIGQRNNCSYIMVSSLSRFEQRQGGEFAVDEPASATFELKLIDSRNGNSLWMSTFAETQESLLSNLFSFNKAMSRGFKWITVEELVARGVRDKLRKNPYLY
ncbi:MAG: hypothetical protein QNJ17_04025 [Desulfocapsaceae bacterium]|nr:hypothetical protein [Desulfocapsaceae bacterium]